MDDLEQDDGFTNNSDDIGDFLLDYLDYLVDDEVRFEPDTDPVDGDPLDW